MRDVQHCLTSWSGGGSRNDQADCVCVCAVCRIVTRQWPCTTLTERYATWSCSSTTRRWPTVNTPSSSTANQWRHTFSWASVSWNWRIMKRPSAIYREVHMGYFGNLRNKTFWDAFNIIGHPPKKEDFLIICSSSLLQTWLSFFFVEHKFNYYFLINGTLLCMVQSLETLKC